MTYAAPFALVWFDGSRDFSRNAPLPRLAGPRLREVQVLYHRHRQRDG